MEGGGDPFAYCLNFSPVVIFFRHGKGAVLFFFTAGHGDG